MPDRRIYSLKQVCDALERQINNATGGNTFWIKAEIAGYRLRRHAYMELVEHRDGQRVAVLRGVIWGSRYRLIEEELGGDLPNVLKEGSEILFRARVRFHAVYGLSLELEEIDLSYALGELERRKQETIATLKKEGLFDLNRQVHEPMVIQRIALITSPGTAAWQDFMDHLLENERGYQFHVHLFEASVQGDRAAAELRAALQRIDPSCFDAVVMVRGGGSKLDLEPFNDLELGRLVARLPIPVMTGIGHDVDVSVVDMIAKSPHKTPTAIADYLVDKCLNFESALNSFLVDIDRRVGEVFKFQRDRISTWAEVLRSRPVVKCQTERGALSKRTATFTRTAQAHLTREASSLERFRDGLRTLPVQKLRQLESARIREMHLALDAFARRGLQALLVRVQGMREAVQLLAPDRLLARGFSITRHQGRALTDPAAVQVGDELETTFARGRARSTITHIKPHGEGGVDL
ncbi:MAG: exodeoxyribonuclease VII large subunit [Flavobacteriales bacterium]|nr:exodeoxyribonuclease VII large subunit [Flavobacteriales bacterium]